MIAAIGARVVLRDDDGVVSQRTNGAQLQVVEVDHQVGRKATRLAVVLVGSAHQCRDAIPCFVAGVFELAAELVPSRVEILRRYDSLGLPTVDVQEDPRVVSALGPRTRCRPIDELVLQGPWRSQLLSHREIAVVDKPLVDAEATAHGARAVVADHQ